MLKYSANNQTFHRSKVEYLNWLGMRDSNPRSWDQNPVPYRLANPHWLYILYSTLEFESDSTHVQRARNFAIANQLASEGFLADC